MKIAFVLGTRPEIIKLFPCIKKCQEESIDYYIIHTNQHYNEEMDKVFFEELNISIPKYNLNIKESGHGGMVGKMMIEIEKILILDKPTHLIVQGDTNSTLAGAITASKMDIKVVHIEAGLRSYDKTMPEEINRTIVDHISDFLFLPTEKQLETSKKEGLLEKSFVVGNTIVDTLDLIQDLKLKTDFLLDNNISKNQYILLTCHRPSNTDNEKRFNQILDFTNKTSKEYNIKCIFPVHPRIKITKEQKNKYKSIIFTEPLNYTNLIKNSLMVLTDSGGIQEESCILEKKCLILRENTERPETVEVGGAEIVENFEIQYLIDKFKILLNKEVNWYNPFGDGKSTHKIFKIIT